MISCTSFEPGEVSICSAYTLGLGLGLNMFDAIAEVHQGEAV